MGNTLRNCVSSPEDNEGSNASLLRENSDRANRQQSGTSSHHTPQGQQQRYFLSPDNSRQLDELSEDEQVKIAKRIGLIGYLPIRFYMVQDKDGDKECVICMVEYENGDELRYLPCTHSFHKACIDAWLMRSFTCPNCSQPVDSALVGSFDPLGGGGGGGGGVSGVGLDEGEAVREAGAIAQGGSGEEAESQSDEQQQQQPESHPEAEPDPQPPPPRPSQSPED